MGDIDDMVLDTSEDEKDDIPTNHGTNGSKTKCDFCEAELTSNLERHQQDSHYCLKRQVFVGVLSHVPSRQCLFCDAFFPTHDSNKPSLDAIRAHLQSCQTRQKEEGVFREHVSRLFDFEGGIQACLDDDTETPDPPTDIHHTHDPKDSDEEETCIDIETRELSSGHTETCSLPRRLSDDDRFHESDDDDIIPPSERHKPIPVIKKKLVEDDTDECYYF